MCWSGARRGVKIPRKLATLKPLATGHLYADIISIPKTSYTILQENRDVVAKKTMERRMLLYGGSNGMSFLLLLRKQWRARLKMAYKIIFRRGDVLNWNPQHPDVFFAKRQLGEGPFTCPHDVLSLHQRVKFGFNSYSSNLFTNNVFYAIVMKTLALSTTDNSSYKEKET